MPSKTKKVASLSGSLLDQERRDPAVGFVLTAVDTTKNKSADKKPRAKRRRTNRNKLNSTSAQEPNGSRSLEAAQHVRPVASAEDSEEKIPEGLFQGPEGKPRSKPENGAPGSPGDAQPEGATGVDLLTALREGNLPLTESIFGHMAGLTPTRAKRALYGPGGRNLALACRALDIEQLQFVSILILTRKLGPRGVSLDPYQLTDLVNYFLKIEKETALKVLRQWQAESIEMFGERS